MMSKQYKDISPIRRVLNNIWHQHSNYSSDGTDPDLILISALKSLEMYVGQARVMFTEQSGIPYDKAVHLLREEIVFRKLQL